MKATEFSRIAKMAMQGGGTNKKWSKRTVDIARAFVLEEQSAKDVAKKFGVTSTYVFSVRRRFQLKARAYQLSVAAAELRPDMTRKITPTKQRAQIQRLLRDGFSVSEIKQVFLANGSRVTLSEIRSVSGKLKP